MRISDWSSDVCSSDLNRSKARSQHFRGNRYIFLARLARRDHLRAQVHRLARAFEPDQHRTVDPGDHLGAPCLEQADREVGRSAAEQIGQHDDAAARVDRTNRVGDFLAPHLHIVVGADADGRDRALRAYRTEEQPAELQALMRISYAVFCLKKKTHHTYTKQTDKTPTQHSTATLT